MDAPTTEQTARLAAAEAQGRAHGPASPRQALGTVDTPLVVVAREDHSDLKRSPGIVLTVQGENGLSFTTQEGFNLGAALVVTGARSVRVRLTTDEGKTFQLRLGVSAIKELRNAVRGLPADEAAAWHEFHSGMRAAWQLRPRAVEWDSRGVCDVEGHRVSPRWLETKWAEAVGPGVDTLAAAVRRWR